MNVPRTTLACVDCRHVKLAVRALRLSLAQCDFAAARLFTDDEHALDAEDARIELVKIPRIASSLEYSRFMLKDLARYIETDFVQVIQWDGYVTRGGAWTDDFLAYDYIGARWWFREEGRNVGNGGFSLRSRKLLDALQDAGIHTADAEDNVICVVHRDRLEKRHGIRFAPAALADRYSFEGTDRAGNEFGFHRVFNLPYFNGETELAAILALLREEDFLSPASVTLVENLARLGRRREALAYAKRLRADPRGYAALPASFRANLERAMLGLAPRTDACPCGKPLAYRRCCGALANWTSVG